MYVSVYARLGYRGVGIGDGSEATPYRRDEASVALAQKAFRGVVVGDGRGEETMVGAGGEGDGCGEESGGASCGGSGAGAVEGQFFGREAAGGKRLKPSPARGSPKPTPEPKRWKCEVCGDCADGRGGAVARLEMQEVRGGVRARCRRDSSSA